MVGFVGCGFSGGRGRSGAPAAIAPRRAGLVATRCVTSSSSSSQAPTLEQMMGAGVSLTTILEKLVAEGVIPKQYAYVVSEWYESYATAIAQSELLEEDPRTLTDKYFALLLTLCQKQLKNPHQFDLFHQSVRKPFDYYQFGLNFARPVINFRDSRVIGVEMLEKYREILDRGENVVILSNHQSEGEPHAIDSVLREVCKNELGRDFIFMAGDRVREDLLAVPFTLGRNILTVYSKKHIEDVPELKNDKLTHNKQTLQEITKLFREGGKLLWIAPSGGRDRRSPDTGKVEVAKFDADAIETMRFVSARSGKKAHFFPMALATYNLLPPPETVDVDMGEKRVVAHVPVNLWFGDELDLSSIAPKDADKTTQRSMRAKAVQTAVEGGYEAIGGREQ